MKSFIVVFLLFATLFSGICQTKTDKNQHQNINRVWMLVKFKNYKKEYFIEKKCYLDLTNLEIAAAKMGCNNLSFSYKKNGNKVKFLNGISTEMACLDMKLESEFSKSITIVKTFSIHGHELILVTSKGTKIKFIAQDWD